MAAVDQMLKNPVMNPQRYDLDVIKATQKDRDVVALILDGKLREVRGEAFLMGLGALLLTPVALATTVAGVTFAIMAFCVETENMALPLPSVLKFTAGMVWGIFALDQGIQSHRGRGNRLIFLMGTLAALLLVYFADGAATPSLTFFLGYTPLGALSFGLMGSRYEGEAETCVEHTADSYKPIFLFHLCTLGAGFVFWGYAEAFRLLRVGLGLGREDLRTAVDILYAAANHNRAALRRVLERIGEERMKHTIGMLRTLNLLYVGKTDLKLTNDGEVALGLRTVR